MCLARSTLIALCLVAVTHSARAQEPTAVPPVVVPPVPGQATGRVVGQVIDRETGRPLAGARVFITGLAAPRETDLDGRYRSGPVAPGRVNVRVAMIGYQAQQRDSVRVVAGQTETVDFALGGITLQVEGINVEAAAVAAPSSDVSLLAMQQAAAQVSDGISAEAIRRSPDNDAADAVTRVTGISVVDNRFVVVRGLPERYNSTLLNGAELPSPDPNRRVVPMDIFPASLLEAIVATKTAAPDRPGDFAGGSVEIRTKEFPDEDVLQASITQGFSTLATFRPLPVAPRSGWDVLGFDDGRRSPDLGLRGEAFAEAFRTVWTPPDQRTRPSLGLSLSLGGQRDLGSVPVGLALSFTYSAGPDHTPERLFTIFSGPADVPPDRALVYRETFFRVNWGAIANFAFRLGARHKLSWRNLYTRNAEEAVISAAGYDTENTRVNQQYQVRYLEQSFLQSQLAGEHQLPGFLNSLVEWKGTLGRARRDEPENRQAYYQYTGQSGGYIMASSQPSSMWIRDLEDRISAAQVDWSLPFRLRTAGDALFKVGALARSRHRDSFAVQYAVRVDLAEPDAPVVAALPPEQAFAPENMGTVLDLENVSQRAQPYVSSDVVLAGYGMLDFFPIRGVRLVAGARHEDWQLDITPQGVGGAVDSLGNPVDATQTTRQADLLWSGNLTIAFGSRTNVRFAGFRSVTRPDAREKSADVAVPVAGACETRGDTTLQRAAAINLDARFEFYRRPGEVLSASVFYKQFDLPIVETRSTPGGAQCQLITRNGEEAWNYGLELELRRAILPDVTAGINLTLVQSRVTMPPYLGTFDSDLPLQGQSPYLVNANVTWAPRARRLSASVLYNYFADRIASYGTAAQGAESQGPNLYEKGRSRLDAKVEVGVGPRGSVSVSCRNLLNSASEFYHPTATIGNVRAGYSREGVSWSLGFGYAF